MSNKTAAVKEADPKSHVGGTGSAHHPSTKTGERGEPSLSQSLLGLTPTSSGPAVVLVRPKVQKVHSTSRKVLERLRQCTRVGGLYCILETTTQGVYAGGQWFSMTDCQA